MSASSQVVGDTPFWSQTGQLWTCGSNNRGQLGFGHSEDVHIFTNVPTLEDKKVTMVAGGWDFTLAVTADGDLYSWGSNGFGQLGIPDMAKYSSVPMKISLEEPIDKVAAGLRHSVALTERGEVYCWGHAKRGQCGPGTEEKPALKYNTPVKVEMPPGVGKLTNIVAGSYHTAALTDKGLVVVWGCNKFGQCVHDPSTTPLVSQPHAVAMDMFGGQKVKVLKSGWTHLIAQTDTGELYSWGRGDYGQLGHPGNTAGHCYMPGKLDTPHHVMAFECGSEHALMVNDQQELCALGWNEHGLCGTGDEVNIHSLTPVDSLRSHKILTFGCGGGHCFAITQEKTDHG